MTTREQLIEAILTEQKKWMQSAVKRPGAFTAKARAAGRSVAAHASYVASHPGQFDTRTKRQANLAKTFAKFRK
jgi:hypothetical protein